MLTLKFAEVHNLVMFLSKPTESEGFEQIVDFLNENPIQYALTLQALVDGKKVIITESTVRRDLQLEDAEDEAINEEMNDSLERASTTASSLEVEEDSGNINKTQSKATPNESSSQRTDSVDETAENQERFNDQEDAEMLFDVADDLRALIEIKSAKPKADKVVIQELKQGASTYTNSFFTTTITGQGLGQGLQVEEQEELTDEEKERWMNTFVDYKTELVVESSKEAEAKVIKGSSKRAREELEQENVKKQKIEDDKEYTELKQCLEIILEDGDDVTIDATPLSSKSPTIIDYKIHKEGKKNYFQIFRADGIANQHGNGNVVAAQAEGNSSGINRNPIRLLKRKKHEFNSLLRNLISWLLQSNKALVNDTDESAEVHLSKNCYDNDIFNMFTQEEQYTELHEPIPEPHQVPQNDSNVIFEVFSVEQELEFQVLIYEKENAHLKIMLKNLFDSINVTWTQTKTIINSLQTKLHDTIYENTNLRARLFVKVSVQNDTTRGTSANTKFAKQSILGKSPSFSRHKLYAATPLPKSTVFPKVGEMNALSNQVTSNSVPSSQESNVVKDDNVLSPRIFRMNPFKASRVDNFVPNKYVKASVKKKLITVSQPHVITKNDVNSKTNDFSSKDVKCTTRTRRP
nr:hypothetical protein [Tanacetum cinerariifolium]